MLIPIQSVHTADYLSSLPVAWNTVLFPPLEQYDAATLYQQLLVTSLYTLCTTFNVLNDWCTLCNYQFPMIILKERESDSMCVLECCSNDDRWWYDDNSSIVVIVVGDNMVIILMLWSWW